MVWEEISIYSRSLFEFQILIPIQILHCHILICQAYLHSTLILLHKTAYLVLHSLVHGYAAIFNTSLKREDADSSIQQKKKSKGTSATASIPAPTGEANSNGTGVARARPASEVNVTPTGARQSSMSPMTGGESMGDSTAATTTTNNSVIETNELLQRMIWR